MSVDATTVRRIAHLARIAVSDAEVPHLQGELNAMLAFVEQLSEVNVVLDELEAADKARAKALNNDDPKNHKTLSPFFCSPINK